MSTPPTSKRARTGASPVSETAPSQQAPLQAFPRLPALSDVESLQPAALHNLVLDLLARHPEHIYLFHAHAAIHGAPVVDFQKFVNQLSNKADAAARSRRGDAAADQIWEDTNAITNVMVAECAKASSAENREACLAALVWAVDDLTEHEHIMLKLSMVGVFRTLAGRMKEVVMLMQESGDDVVMAVEMIEQIDDREDYGVYDFSELAVELRKELLEEDDDSD